MWASTSSTIDAPGASPVAPEDAREFEQTVAGANVPRVLLFTAAGRTCACELPAVREIVPYRRATRLPGAPPYVIGLINLRGSIITVLDLGVRLGGAAVNPERGSIVLVESRSKVVGLAVDELRDVQRIPEGTIQAADDDPGGEGLVSGVLRVDGDVAVLLNVGRIVGLALL